MLDANLPSKKLLLMLSCWVLNITTDRDFSAVFLMRPRAITRIIAISPKNLTFTGSEMKVAFVHDWLVTYRGGEKVLDSLIKLYPEAPIYTLFYRPDKMPASIRKRQILVHPLANRLVKVRKALLPFLPAMIESFELTDYDLIISSSSCVAKGVLGGPSTTHLCYLHSPMRYIWDQRQDYLGSLPALPGVSGLAQLMSSWLRQWDVASCPRVDRFIVNSSFVGQRVARYYARRDVTVIHPPIELERFFLARQSKPVLEESYFLVAGAMVSYKRFDLAISAAKAACKKLVVAGSGPQLGKLKRLAGPEVIFYEAPSNELWDRLMAHAEAFLFCGIEDFGMTAIESLAAGTPVIAAKGGGALDFIEDGKNGRFFKPGVVASPCETPRTHSK